MQGRVGGRDERLKQKDCLRGKEVSLSWVGLDKVVGVWTITETRKLGEVPCLDISPAIW